MVSFQDSMRAEEHSFTNRSSQHIDTEDDESFKQIKYSSYEEINITETVNLQKEKNKNLPNHHPIQTDKLGDNTEDNTNQSGNQRKSYSQHMDNSQSMMMNQNRYKIESYKPSHSKSHTIVESKVDNIQFEEDHGESQCHDDDQSDSQNLQEYSSQIQLSPELCDNNHCGVSKVVSERLHNKDDDKFNYSIPGLEAIEDKTVINDDSMVKSEQKKSSTRTKRSTSDSSSIATELNNKTLEPKNYHIDGENILENTKKCINIPSNASCNDLERSWTDKDIEEESWSLVTKVC